jgi:hypothetical protein
MSDARDDRFHLRHVVDQHVPERRAFARAHFDEIRNGLPAAREHCFAQCFLRHRTFREHARPAKNLAGAHALGIGEDVEHGALERGELHERIAIQRASVGRLLHTVQIDADIDLAARELCHQHFAQLRLGGSHVFGHAEVQVEKARIHRAQFHRYPDARTARAIGSGAIRDDFARRAGIACHAVDHGTSRDVSLHCKGLFHTSARRE